MRAFRTAPSDYPLVLLTDDAALLRAYPHIRCPARCFRPLSTLGGTFKMSAGRLRVLGPSIEFGYSPMIGPASARNAHCWRCGSVRDPASSHHFHNVEKSCRFKAVRPGCRRSSDRTARHRGFGFHEAPCAWPRPERHIAQACSRWSAQAGDLSGLAVRRHAEVVPAPWFERLAQPEALRLRQLAMFDQMLGRREKRRRAETVSYTHLTLPTNREV